MIFHFGRPDIKFDQPTVEVKGSSRPGAGPFFNVR
jgi:hypothetical protein